MKYDTQIYRIDGKNCFLEVLNTGFSMRVPSRSTPGEYSILRKVQINMIQYDENTHAQKQKLEFYLDFPDAMVLCNEITSGRLDIKMARAAKEGSFEGRPINDYTAYWQNLGGKAKPSEKDRETYNWLEPGSALSRQLKIQKSTKYKYMIVGEYGKGKVGPTGLIIPDGSRKAYVQVPVNESDALGLALTLVQHMNAYWNQYYARFSDALFPQQGCNVFTPDSSVAGKQPQQPTQEEFSSAEEPPMFYEPESEEQPAPTTAPAPENHPKQTQKTVRLKATEDLKKLITQEGSYYLTTDEDGNEKIIVFLESETKKETRWGTFKETLAANIAAGKTLSFGAEVIEQNGKYYFKKFTLS